MQVVTGFFFLKQFEQAVSFKKIKIEKQPKSSRSADN